VKFILVSEAELISDCRSVCRTSLPCISSCRFAALSLTQRAEQKAECTATNSLARGLQSYEAEQYNQK